MSRLAMILVFALLLAGCDPKNTKAITACPTIPVEVETVRNVFVPIRPDLTAPVADPAPAKVKTGGELKDAYDARGAALMACNGRLSDIRGIEATPVDTAGKKP